MGESKLVCGAPSLNKNKNLTAYPIHIVVYNMIIVVKYVLVRRKRERSWIINYDVLTINVINYKLYCKSNALLIVELLRKASK